MTFSDFTLKPYVTKVVHYRKVVLKVVGFTDSHVVKPYKRPLNVRNQL